MPQYSVNAFASEKSRKWKLTPTGHFFVLALTRKREMRQFNLSTPPMNPLNIFTACGLKIFKCCFSWAFYLLSVSCLPIDTKLEAWSLKINYAIIKQPKNSYLHPLKLFYHLLLNPSSIILPLFFKTQPLVMRLSFTAPRDNIPFSLSDLISHMLVKQLSKNNLELWFLGMILESRIKIETPSPNLLHPGETHKPFL